MLNPPPIPGKYYWVLDPCQKEDTPIIAQCYRSKEGIIRFTWTVLREANDPREDEYDSDGSEAALMTMLREAL